MATAAQFQHRLDEIKLEDTQGAQSALRQILEDLNREIQVIRGQYNPRIAAAEAGALGRQSSNRQRVIEMEKLETERDQKLQPFQEMKEKVETLLAQGEEKTSGTNP